MFSPAAMMRLSVVVLERDERVALRELGRLGTVQLTCRPAGPDTAPLPPPDRRAELARCDGLLARIEELRRALEIHATAEEMRIVARVEAWEEAGAAVTLEQAEENLRLLEAPAARLVRSRQDLLKRRSDLAAVGGRLARYGGLDLPLDGPDRFTFLHFITGTLPMANLEQLRHEVGGAVALLPLPGEKDRQPLIAMTTHDGRPALEQALQRAGFQTEPLPVVAGATAEQLAVDGRREQEQAAAELARLRAETQTLAAADGPRLAALEQRVRVERRLLEAEQQFTRTERAVLITGWIPAREVSAAMRRLRDGAGGRCVIETVVPEPGEDEQIPILLRNPRWLQPFARLVTAYGLPRYRDVEPTLLVAVSYVLMFGMMFGDVGQGAVLALAGLVVRFARRAGKWRDAGLPLLFAGLSSCGFGAVYGSCFGLPPFRKYALWHDPLEGDPAALMAGAIGMGILMISLGLALNIINHFRRGDWLGGVLDKFGLLGALFYWGVLAVIFKQAAIREHGLMGLALVLVFAVPVAGWMLKGPVEHFRRRRGGHSLAADGNLLEVVADAFSETFEGLLSYLANTISFVRLAAYALSHAALLAAAFMMAEQVRQLPAVGGVLGVLVIILGNLVAVALEGIVASIQALRLEYYEFFGKFFSGGGRPFTPFRLPVKDAVAVPP